MVKAPYWHFPDYQKSPAGKLVRYLFTLTGVEPSKSTTFNRQLSPAGKWSAKVLNKNQRISRRRGKGF